MPIQRIALGRRPAPLSVWGNRVLFRGVIVLGIALCSVSLVPLVGSLWILVAAVAEHFHKTSLPLGFAAFLGVIAAWSWTVVWTDTVETLQSHLLRPKLDRLLALQPADRRYFSARIRRGTGEANALPDVGYLVATGVEMRFIGGRTEFKVHAIDATRPARRTGMDTVVLPVGRGKSGLFFTATKAQDLVLFINQWRESTEVVLAQSVDKPEAQG